MSHLEADTRRRRPSIAETLGNGMHATLALIAVAALIAIGAPTAAWAQGPPPCGTVVTDTALTADCQAPLTVAADDIKVDLGGHQVLCLSSPTGIEVIDRQDVRIENGQVNNCGVAVWLQGGGGHRVQSLSITSAPGVGIRIDASDDNLLRHTEIFGVRAFGVEVSGDGNRIVANELSGIVANGGTAIRLLAGATGTLVRANHVHDNVVGIEVGGSDNVVRNNRANDNIVGITVTGSDNTVVANTANDNSMVGIQLIEQAGTANRMRFNRARRNELYDLADYPAGLCTANMWHANRGALLLDGCETGVR